MDGKPTVKRGGPYLSGYVTLSGGWYVGVDAAGNLWIARRLAPPSSGGVPTDEEAG